MKKIFLTISFLAVNLTYGQFQFPDLKYIEIASSYLGGTFGYPESSNFQFINRSCSDIPDCYEYEDPTILVGRWKLDNNTSIEFHYTEAPSDDPTFIAVYSGKIILEEAGTTLHLKGDILYVEGNANSFFDKKRKFKLIDSAFQEVHQPFYHIGAKGNLNYPIEIYKDESYTDKIAVLPKGHNIDIILGKTGGEYDDLESILVKSEFGLLGWFNFKDVAFGEPIIDRFYYHGD